MVFRLSIGICCSKKDRQEVLAWKDRVNEAVRQIHQIVNGLTPRWYLDVMVFHWNVTCADLEGGCHEDKVKRALEFVTGSVYDGTWMTPTSGEKKGITIHFDPKIRGRQLREILACQDELIHFARRADEGLPRRVADQPQVSAPVH